MKPRPEFKTPALLLIAALVANFACGPTAHAELPGMALDSPIARFLLTETAEGAAIASRLLGREARSFQELRGALEATPNLSARQSLETRLTRIREDFHRARALRASGEEVPESRELNAEERTLLTEIAARELRIRPEWRPGVDPRPGQIEFVTSVAPNAESAESFLAKEGDFTQQGQVEASKLPEAERKSLWERATEPFKKMKACVQNEPPEIARRSEIATTIKQTLISEGITVGATYFTAGQHKVDKANLSGDMLMTLFSSAVGGLILKNSDTFLVRWNKSAQFGVGRSQVDTAYYYITPWKTVPKGYDVDSAALERLQFNTVWNLSTSLTSPTVFTLTSGMECLYRGTKWESAVGAGTFLFRTGVSLSNAVIYYEVRGSHIGQNPH